MKLTTTHFALCLIGLAGAAIAMSESAADADANGDGVLTLDEVQTVFPTVSTDMFVAMDINADGALDETEITAAEEAGVMPTEPSGS